MSRRIVLATLGSFGDLHPYMALALGLMARGHRPVIATNERYREKIAAAGIDFHPIRPDITEFGDERELLRRVMDSSQGSEYVLREVVMPWLEVTYADTRAICESADLLVSHPLTYTVPIIAEQFRKSWVATVLQPMMFLSRFDPPLLPKGQFLAPLYCRSSWLAGALMQVARFISRGWFRSLDDLRRSLNLPPSAKNPIFEGQFSPYGNLALFSHLLGEPQPDWPVNTTVTGFAFYDREEHALDMPRELAQFLDAGPPPIVFTLGTSAVMVAGDFYRDSLAAAKQLHRRAVFLIGKDERNHLENLPEGMLAVNYAPYSELFPRAAAIVHQGGAGTTGQAMRSGKPMVVVPFAHDQPDHAARLKRLKISETVPRHKYSAPTAVRALQRVLNDPRYAQRACIIGEQVRQENGVATACAILENIG